MNTSILKKAIEELRLKDPNLSYLRGMLETLLEVQEPKSVSPAMSTKPYGPSEAPKDEASSLDAEAQAKLLQLRKDGIIA